MAAGVTGHRLPPGVRLGRVLLQVADLQRSLAWYHDVLGLRAAAATPGRATLAAPGAGRPLVELRERPGAAPVPQHGRLGLYHFALLVPDRAELGTLIAHLHRNGISLGAADHLVSEAIYLQDPDGLGIEVYADRPRSAWRYRDGELLMTTEPLDLDGLLRIGHDRPWSGMPAGTVVGHLHLSVRDLAQAADFYHLALGLERMVWTYPGALFLAAGGYHHHLGLNTWARLAQPPEPDDARLLEWVIALPDTAATARALAALSDAGCTVAPAPGGGRVQDPWGTTLLLTAAADHG